MIWDCLAAIFTYFISMQQNVFPWSQGRLDSFGHLADAQIWGLVYAHFIAVERKHWKTSVPVFIGVVTHPKLWKKSHPKRIRGIELICGDGNSTLKVLWPFRVCLHFLKCKYRTLKCWGHYKTQHKRVLRSCFCCVIPEKDKADYHLLYLFVLSHLS